VVDCDFLPDRDSLVIIRPFNSTGSLKDYMHKAHPKDAYSKKYRKLSPLPLERVALFGRHILEVAFPAFVDLITDVCYVGTAIFAGQGCSLRPLALGQRNCGAECLQVGVAAT
jgi:hypothetical protein